MDELLQCFQKNNIKKEKNRFLILVKGCKNIGGIHQEFCYHTSNTGSIVILQILRV